MKSNAVANPKTMGAITVIDPGFSQERQEFLFSAVIKGKSA